MTIYRLWLLSLADKSIVYSKYFPHLEKKDGFIFPCINSQEFIKCLYISLGIDSNDETSTHIPINKTESNMNITFPTYGQENVSPSYRQYSSSSSCSLTSMTSSMLNTTMNTSRRTSFDSSQLSVSNILKEYICLYTHLPLIVCPLVYFGKHENSMNLSCSEDHKLKNGVDNLILLVYEQHGYLFICCPRLVATKNDDIWAKANDCLENGRLLVEEHNISLAYTILHMLASMFFIKNKSIRTLEWFISTYMPFGNLIKTGSDRDVGMLSTFYSKNTTINIILTESISTSFQKYDRLTANSSQNETTFGTITIDFLNSKLKYSKAEIIINVGNLKLVSLVLPANCKANDSTLVYDVSDRSQYNLNMVYYKSHIQNEEKNNITHPAHLDSRNQQQSSSMINTDNLELFRTEYKIYKKSSSGQQTGKSPFIDFKNMHHISLRILLNEKIPVEAIKFKYFMVKFSLKRGLKKGQVTTMDNSINNLVVRESMQVNQGKVKNENNMLVWIIGSKLPRSRKVTIDFDLFISKENLENLDTRCNFSHTFKFKNLLTPKTFRSISTRMTTNEGHLIQFKECKIIYPSDMLTPYLKLSRITLKLELLDLIKLVEENKTSSKDEYFQFEYHLNSFEYRIFPIVLDNL